MKNSIPAQNWAENVDKKKVFLGLWGFITFFNHLSSISDNFNAFRSYSFFDLSRNRVLSIILYFQFFRLIWTPCYQTLSKKFYSATRTYFLFTVFYANGLYMKQTSTYCTEIQQNYLNFSKNFVNKKFLILDIIFIIYDNLQVSHYEIYAFDKKFLLKLFIFDQNSPKLQLFLPNRITEIYSKCSNIRRLQFKNNTTFFPS